MTTQMTKHTLRMISRNTSEVIVAHFQVGPLYSCSLVLFIIPTV